MKNFRKLERAFDDSARKFVFRHPVLGFLSIFIGIPVFMVAAVGAGTLAVVFPISMVAELL